MTEKERGIAKRIADIMNPYSWITSARNRMFDKGILRSRTFPVPTICIGNISVGGTGKTPHTEYLIELLNKRFNIAVLSRGYGRKSTGYILAETDTAMEAIGDEPFQIKNKFKETTVAVCEKRAVGIERIVSETQGTDVILLDDAFQHRHVKAGMNILLIDSSRPIWQDCILPFGRMRESMRGIKRADIAIMTKCNSLTKEQAEWCRNHIKSFKNIPVFFSRMRYGELYPLFTQGKKEISCSTEVLLVTGIARPMPLKHEIESRGAKTKLLGYADHHNFRASDFVHIEKEFKRIKGEDRIIVTTEKDAARILQYPDVPQAIKEHIHAMPIEVEILNGEGEVFNRMILDYVAENSRNS